MSDSGGIQGKHGELEAIIPANNKYKNLVAMCLFKKNTYAFTQHRNAKPINDPMTGTYEKAFVRTIDVIIITTR